jgi:flagellar hook protein FlgE
VVQWAGQGAAGTITPSSIEGSNVDIATELTQMIVAQRAYTSNSKVITAADQMIQDALALIH